ncbi:MAG: DUF4149 domain-containing protein [Actinobacteria bacterium]|nr:DUF4149 domain-containing protein [Actinomycetota bacterium]
MLALDVMLRWLHVVSVALRFGGMLFLALIVVPTMRRAGLRDAGAAFLRVAGERFRGYGWAALALLATTGTLMLVRRGYPGPAELFDRPFGTVLVAKLSLVALVLILSAAHDFWLGPRTLRLASERGAADPAYRRARSRVSWLARLNALLVAAIIGLGLWLTRLG